MKYSMLSTLMLVSMLASPLCSAATVAEQSAPLATPAVAGKAISYSGGDGATMESAVVIEGASNTSAGITAERKWVTEKYPGFKKVRQSLLRNEGKSYDLIEIETAEGKAVSIYFDISGFFGKW